MGEYAEYEIAEYESGRRPVSGLHGGRFPKGYWKSKNKGLIKIENMDLGHIDNCIRLCENCNNQEKKEELEAERDRRLGLYIR